MTCRAEEAEEDRTICSRAGAHNNPLPPHTPPRHFGIFSKTHFIEKPGRKYPKSHELGGYKIK